MSSKQTLLCCEGLALSVQCGFEVVGCPEHKSFSRRCLDCCARETSQISPCREGEAGRQQAFPRDAAPGAPRLPGASSEADVLEYLY